MLISSSLSMWAQETEQKKFAAVFTPEHIIAGSTGNIVTYDPSGTVLENETDLHCVMYLYEDYVWTATDVALQQKEGQWTGTFDVPQNASLLTCKFTSGSMLDGPDAVKTDWGWPATYSSFILDAEKRCKPGSYIAWGLLRQKDSQYSIPGLLEDSTAAPIDDNVVLFWFNTEFRYYPEEQPKNYGRLVSVLNQVMPGQENEHLASNVKLFLADRNLVLTDQQWSDIYDVCLRTLRDTVLADEVKAREQEIFKHGIIERDEEIRRIQQLFVSDIPQGLGDFDKFMETYPSEKFRNVHSFTTDLFYAKLFRSPIYSQIMKYNDYGNLRKYIHDIPYDELLSTHWHVVKVCFNNGQLTAGQVYPYSQLIVDELLGRPRESDAQKLRSPREYEEYKVAHNVMPIFCHARILTALGKYDEAMKYAEQVYPYYGAKDTGFAEIWVKLLQQNGRMGEVKPFLEECVGTNQISQGMIDILRTEYIKENPQGDFDGYYAGLADAAKMDAERRKAISELIDQPIQLYELEKLGGGKVNLADKKGKVIFMDFWATWCAPCKASMPGGQMVVDRYKDDSDVEFYFVDTNETAKDYRQKVADFIQQKGYTFNVLFDEGEPGHQDKVYKNYCALLHTSGIPFKIIIDQKGRLRWAKCGYTGSPSGMADEIQYVIDYLKNENR